MAWLNVHFYSKVLGLTCTMDVILPEPDEGIGVTEAVWDGKTPLPVLYLLHGMSDDHTIWMRRTSIDRYAAGRRMAIVMPAVHRSSYTNQKFGYDYLTFIAEEIPTICRRFFKISEKREENFVAGLSMGGHGAMKIGLNYPQNFGAVASMSGLLDYSSLTTTSQYDIIGNEEALKALKKSDFASHRRVMDYLLSFGSGSEYAGSENDLIAVLEHQVEAGVSLPNLHISIGSDDYLYPTNASFRKKLDELNVPYTYVELPGVHQWAFWDARIQEVLDWLPVEYEKPIGNRGAEEAEKFKNKT